MGKKLHLLLIITLFAIGIKAQNQGFTAYNQGTQFVSVEVDDFNNRVWAVKRYVGNSIMKLEDTQDPVPTEFTTFEGVTPTGTPLKNYFIRDIAIDFSGNVWVAHYGYGNNNVVGGVEKIRTDLSIKHYYAYDAGGGLQTRKVRSIIVDDNDKVWAAQYHHRLIGTPPGAGANTTTIWPGTLAWKSEYDFDFNVLGNTYRCSGQPTEPTGPNLPYPRNTFGEIIVPDSAQRNFQALSSDDTEIWASHWAYETGDDDCTSTHATINDRILRYNLDGTYAGELFPETAGTVVNICRNNEKGTWITTHLDSGFSVYKGGSWVHIDPANFPNVIPPGTGFNANAMWKDENGKVYMGTTNGLIVYNGVGVLSNESSYKLYTNYDFGADPNSASYVYDDTMISRNIFGGCSDPRDSRVNWLATENGIMKMGVREGVALLHIKDYTTYDSSTVNQNSNNNIEFLAELPNIELPEEQIPTIAADGSGSTIFRIYTTTPENYYGNTPIYTPKIFIENEFGDNVTDVDINRFGKFIKKDLASYPNNPASIADLEYVDFIYQHPDHIEEIDYEINEIYELVNFKIIDQNDNEIESRNLKIAIPPIMLGHGVWSSINSLVAMEAYLLSIGFPDYTILKFFRTNDQLAEHSFFNDRLIIPNKIKELKERARKNKFSVGKINFIVHSRGGLYTRAYIEGEYNILYKEDINSLITVDTPHFGSQGANIVLDKRVVFTSETAIDFFIDNINIQILADLIVPYTEVTLGEITNPIFPSKNDGDDNWGAKNLLVEDDQVSGLDMSDYTMRFISDLNTPFNLNKLRGTPIHTISSSCNPCSRMPILCLDPVDIQEDYPKLVKPIIFLRSWLQSNSNTSHMSSVNDVTLALYKEENDFIVPKTSMTAGLSGNYNTHFGTNLSLDHTGAFGLEFGIMNNSNVHNEIKRLLTTNVNDESANGLFTKNGITNQPRTYDFLHEFLAPAQQRSSEAFTSKILINRDPNIFDNRMEGDILNFNIYQENIDRIMVVYQSEDQPDKFSYEQKKQIQNFATPFTYAIPQGYSGKLTITAYGFKNGDMGIAKSIVTLNVGIPTSVTLQSIHFTTEEPVILEQDNYSYTVMGTYSDGIDRILNNENITFTIENTNILTSVDNDSVKGENVGISLLKASINGFEDTIKVRVIENPSLRETILTSFYGTPNADNSTIDVNWETLREYENASFVLETSYNTLDNFTEVNQQAGNGTTNTPAQFNFADTTFGANTVIYYRIKMIDTQGNITYSSTIEINLSTAGVEENNLKNLEVEVYPNPANTDEVTLKLNSKLIDKNAKLELYSLQGKRLSKQTLNVLEGANSFKLKIGQGLTNGIYLIKVSTAGYVKTVKLIVKK